MSTAAHSRESSPLDGSDSMPVFQHHFSYLDSLFPDIVPNKSQTYFWCVTSILTSISECITRDDLHGKGTDFSKIAVHCNLMSREHTFLTLKTSLVPENWYEFLLAQKLLGLGDSFLVKVRKKNKWMPSLHPTFDIISYRNWETVTWADKNIPSYLKKKKDKKMYLRKIISH